MQETINSNNLYKEWGPKTVQIELINLCNARCQMCDRWKWTQNNRDSIGNLKTQELLSLFDELKKLGTETVLFTGGEPLLFKDFEKLVNYLTNKDITSAMFTTGIALNQKIGKALVEANAKIVFSIDGATRETYRKIRGVNAHEQIVNNIRNLVETRNKKESNEAVIGINATIQRDNAHEIFELYELAKVLKVDFIRFGLVHGETSVSINETNVPQILQAWKKLKNESEKTHTKVFMSPFLSEIAEKQTIRPDVKKGLPTKELFERKKVNCPKVHEYSLIDAFGMVYPCTYAYFDNQPFSEFNDRRKNYCLGDIREKSFTKIWNGERYNQFRKKVSPVNIQETANACGQCEHFFEFSETQEILEIAFQNNDKKQLSKALEKMQIYEFDRIL